MFKSECGTEGCGACGAPCEAALASTERRSIPKPIQEAIDDLRSYATNPKLADEIQTDLEELIAADRRGLREESIEEVAEYFDGLRSDANGVGDWHSANHNDATAAKVRDLKRFHSAPRRATVQPAPSPSSTGSQDRKENES